MPGPGFNPWFENENPVSHAAQPKKLEINKVKIKEALKQSLFGQLSKSPFPEQREHSVAGPVLNISPHQVLEAAYVGLCIIPKTDTKTVGCILILQVCGRCFEAYL